MKLFVQFFLLGLFITQIGYAQKRTKLNPNEIKSWVSRHNLTPKQYQNEVNKNHKNGFRLVYVDGYNVNGNVKFAALWKKRNTKGLLAKHGLSSTAYQKEVKKNHKKGYRLVFVDGYNQNGKATYAAIWNKQKTKGLRAKHGLTSKQYNAEVKKNYKDGYKLLQVSGYGIKGKAYYAAIWAKTKGFKQITKHGLSGDKYQKEISNYWKKGYRITHTDSYSVNGKIQYAFIMNKLDGRYSARHNLNSKNFQLQVDNHYYQGFMPISISGHDAGKSAGFTAVFKSVGGWKSKDANRIEDKVRAVMKKYDIPATSVAIVKNGKLVYAKGFGYGNKEKKEIASATSLYRIASVSKPITSVAIFKLIEDTNLTLEKKVFGSGRVLGTTYGKKSYGTREKQIRIRHLLEHRAGGNSWDNNTDPNPGNGPEDTWSAPMFQNRDFSKKKLIGWVLDSRNPSDKVNTVTAYSNFGFSLLGRVIEKKSGMSYEAYVRNKVLKPCGIKNMYIGSSKKDGRRYKEVVYYGDKNTNPYRLQMSRMDSHGGWIASVVDLMRFAVRVDGNPVKKDILKSKSIKAMQSSSYGGRFGKGWVLSGSLMQHNGRMSGTRALLKLMDNGIYYAYAVNKYNGEDDPQSDMVEAIEKAINEIKYWPTIDLF